MRHYLYKFKFIVVLLHYKILEIIFFHGAHYMDVRDLFNYCMNKLAVQILINQKLNLGNKLGFLDSRILY